MLLVNIYPDMAEPYTDVQGLEHAVCSTISLLWTSDSPSLIFMGVGAMTGLGPLIANPISFIMGAAAQLGIYLAYFFAISWIQWKRQQLSPSSAVPTPDFYLPSEQARQQQSMGPIAVAAYSYMSQPIIQPPVMKLLTTEKSVKSKWRRSNT